MFIIILIMIDRQGIATVSLHLFFFFFLSLYCIDVISCLFSTGVRTFRFSAEIQSQAKADKYIEETMTTQRSPLYAIQIMKIGRQAN